LVWVIQPGMAVEKSTEGAFFLVDVHSDHVSPM
jgi:hypothetical protein